VSLWGQLSSQSALGFSREIGFISHLQDNNEFRNSAYLCTKLDTATLSADQKDSLSYYQGWAYYNVRDLDTSAYFLKKVKSNSPYYNKSVFYAATNYAYTKKYSQALSVVKKEFIDTSYNQLMYLQKGGLFLLQRDYSRFDSVSKCFNYSDFYVAAEQKEMLLYRKKLSSYKKKSPFVAGLLSTAVPGLGKFYAGKRGQALATAAACFVTGIVAAENLYRGGVTSPQFIITGTIFSFFYIGNIWGSVISVKMARRSFNDKTDNDIRVSIHLPLRRIFN
jgi:TM2 domain-containing membrane protein YozV